MLYESTYANQFFRPCTRDRRVSEEKGAGPWKSSQERAVSRSQHRNWYWNRIRNQNCIFGKRPRVANFVCTRSLRYRSIYFVTYIDMHYMTCTNIRKCFFGLYGRSVQCTLLLFRKIFRDQGREKYVALGTRPKL